MFVSLCFSRHLLIFCYFFKHDMCALFSFSPPFIRFLFQIFEALQCHLQGWVSVHFITSSLSGCSFRNVHSPLRCHMVSLLNLSPLLLCSSFTRHVGPGPTLIQNDLIGSWLHWQQPCSPIRSSPQALKGRTSFQPTCGLLGRREMEQRTDTNDKTWALVRQQESLEIDCNNQHLLFILAMIINIIISMNNKSLNKIEIKGP